jgi:hypothetical protein
MTTHGNDGAFPSSIQRRNICQNSRIKHDPWRETLRRFQLDPIPNLMTTHGNDGAFPSSIQRRNIWQNSRIDDQVFDERGQECSVFSRQSPRSYHSNCLRNSAKVARNSANSVSSSSTRSSSWPIRSLRCCTTSTAAAALTGTEALLSGSESAPNNKCI